MHWVEAHEDALQAKAHGHLVIVRRPGRKRLELEIVCRSRSDSSALLKEFGGRIEALPRNWLERVRRSFSEGGPPERLKLRLAGQPSDVLRLPTKIGISPKTAIRRINLRSAATAQRS